MTPISAKRRSIHESVFEGERCYTGDWPPEKPADFLAWWQEKIEAIPEEFRDTATIEIDSRSGYEGSHDPCIKIGYWRQETDTELATRLTAMQQDAVLKEMQARATYEELRRRFGDDPLPR